MSNNPKLATEQQVKDVSDTFTEIINHQGKQIKALESGVIDAIEPSSPAPTKRGEYKVTKVGVYINFKDGNGQPISVTEEDYSSGNVSIIYNGTDNRKLVVPITFEGEVKEGDTRGVSGNIVDTYLQDGNFTYNPKINKDLLKPFLELVKNIHISSELNISKSNVRISYLGINHIYYAKVLVQLIYTDIDDIEYPVNFYIPSGVDSKEIKGETVLLVSEKQSLFGRTTQVFCSFRDFDNFPISKTLIGMHDDVDCLRPSAFLYGKDKISVISNFSYNLLEGTLSNTNTGIFKSTVKNIFIKSSINDIVNNVKISYLGMNDYGRHLLIQLRYKNEAVSFILKDTDKDILGGKIIKMNYKDGSGLFKEKTDVYVEFYNFDKYPTTSFLTGLETPVVLFESCFKTPEINSIFNSYDVINSKTIIEVSLEKDGHNAIQNTINNILDANENNRYEIRVSRGSYKASNSSDFKGHKSDYPAFICPKDYIDIIGVDGNDCILYAGLPYLDSEIDTGISRNMHQTVYNYANESTLENLTIISENIRYTIHQDSPLETNKKRYYNNITTHFKGNIGYRTALGIGTYSGSETYFVGGKTICDALRVLSIHNNQVFEKPSVWSFKGHQFINMNNDELLELCNSGSLIGDKFEIVGCGFGFSKIFNYKDLWIYTHAKNSHFNHAEWRVTGYGNDPFFFNNTVEGCSLAIKSKSKGKNSKIRFIGGTAFDLLIKNPHKNKFGQIGHPERFIVNDAYIAFDGEIGVSGYAIGCIGVRETLFDNGEKNNQEPIGKRLGDCTVNSKTLIVDIDGVSKTIWFEQDYTNKSNSEIIFSINSFLNTVGAEAYITNVGLDYYPELSDVNYVVKNSGTTIIPKGSLVSMTDKGVKICNEGDIIYGLLIDDLKPYTVSTQGKITGYGRVIKNCYVTTTQGNISSVRTQGIGDRYKVIDGILVADPNGTIKSMAGLILI